MPCVNTSPRQRGGAIILAMVTVILASSIAAAIVASLGRSLDSAIGYQDQAQARLLARGAIDWARNVLAEDARSTPVDHLQEPWSVKIPPTPVENGEVSGEIRDCSGLYNLNDLGILDSFGQASPQTLEEFERLLNVIGIDHAPVLARNLQQWVSVPAPVKEQEQGQRPNPSPPPQANAQYGPLADISELLFVPGFDADVLARLRPFVVAVPSPSKINLNTASPEVLVAITADLALDKARILVAERERIWFRNLLDYKNRLDSANVHVTAATWERVDVRSHYFLITGRARYGKAMVQMEVLLQRHEVWPDILWHRIL